MESRWYGIEEGKRWSLSLSIINAHSKIVDNVFIPWNKRKSWTEQLNDFSKLYTVDLPMNMLEKSSQMTAMKQEWD